VILEEKDSEPLVVMIEQQPKPSIPVQPAPSTGITWPLLVVIGLGGAGIAWFLATDAAVFLVYTPEKYTDYYWPRRGGMILHVSAGALALTVGLVQIFLGLSGRTRRLHRVLGRIYLGAVLVGVSASCYLAVTIPPGSPAYTLGLVGLGIAWFFTTVAGYRALMLGNVAGHRAWMIRSFAVTFSFVTLRVIATMIASLGLMSYDDATSPAAWLCWIVPLAIVEIGHRRWHWGGERVNLPTALPKD
jgi:uncharacterized membrane protein YozB (DUF420 family)